MAGDFFLWALAGATAAAAIALLAVLFRRTRREQHEPGGLRSSAVRGRRGPPEAATEDEEPDGAWGDLRTDDPPDLAKICPACGLRYGLESRTCERDNSELAAIN
ncbi:MAG: hypothetical protein JRI68_00335 [Deltaproteobacteria bacterium]|nr:hypothetical protein [Deltaproteobacteria bacterium]